MLTADYVRAVGKSVYQSQPNDVSLRPVGVRDAVGGATQLAITAVPKGFGFGVHFHFARLLGERKGIRQPPQEYTQQLARLAGTGNVPLTANRTPQETVHPAASGFKLLCRKP